MKYKCLKCLTEFDVTYDATCPKCQASGFDVETLRKWKRAHPVEEETEEELKVEEKAE